MLVTWHNLNFCVPLTKEDKKFIKDSNAVSNELIEPLKEAAPTHLNIKIQNGV